MNPTTRIRFQVCDVSEAGVPKSVERIRLGMLIGGKTINVGVGNIQISFEEGDKEIWGRFKLGDIYEVDFTKEVAE